MKKYKELWALVVALVSGVAVVVGGFCLFVECNEIGWFPEDMTLGEGVALYGLFVGLTISGGLYWLGITSVGLLVVRWPMELLIRYKRDVPPHAAGYVPTSLKAMWASPVWVIALIAVIVAIFSVRLEPLDGVRYGSIAVLQGFFGAVLLVVRRRLQFDRSGISLPRIDTTASAQRATDFRQVGYALLGIWILGPFLFGQNQGSLIDAAFRLAQLRKDHATVHVAAPWDSRLIDSGLQRHNSFLGATYARFDNVTVRMRSVGSRVVLEIPSKPRSSRFINIPRQFVEIE